MDNEKTKVMERVRKLLAMANDASSPNEAMIAAGRARKLMDKYNLTQGEIERLSTGDASFATVRAGQARAVTPKWEQYLGVAVADLNDCVAIRRMVNPEAITTNYWQIEFQGEECDIQAAKAMYEYLIEQVKSLCSDYMADQGYARYNARIGDAYKKAAASAINDMAKRMVAERSQAKSETTGQSLMVMKKELVAQHFKHYGYKNESWTPNPEDYEARIATVRGYKDGSNVTVNKQVES